MSNMLWIVPSRSRPSNIPELVRAFQVTRCMADMLVVVDDDDPKLPEYQRVRTNFIGFDWFGLISVPRLKMVPKLNQSAVEMAKKYDIIGFMGDDHRPKSPIWDGLMAAQLRKMGTGIVYANDLFQGESLPTSVAMTTDIISALGYMVPPTIEHLYCDNFWMTLGQSLGRIEYMEHVVIEHLHPHAGKAESDPQYKEVNSQRQYEHDKNAFETYLRKGLDSDLIKIKEIMK